MLLHKHGETYSSPVPYSRHPIFPVWISNTPNHYTGNLPPPRCLFLKKRKRKIIISYPAANEDCSEGIYLHETYMVPVRQLLLPFCLLYIICVIRHFGYVFVHFASRRINEGAIKKRILLFFFFFLAICFVRVYSRPRKYDYRIRFKGAHVTRQNTVYKPTLTRIEKVRHV